MHLRCCLEIGNCDLEIPLWGTMPRFAKQLFFGLLFLAVLVGVSVWIWAATRPQASCFDAMQNQNEQGVDCGGMCANICKKEPRYPAIFLIRADVFSVQERAYDVVAELENKNTDFGALSFGYEFKLVTASGTVVASRRGMSYALPRERKFIIEQRLEAPEPVASVTLAVFEEQWVELSDFPRLTLVVRDRMVQALAPGAYESGVKASGVVVNRTGLDIASVDLVVLVRNAAGSIIGVGATDVRTFKDGEQRAFEVQWPHMRAEEIERADFEVYTNMLANENFLSRYGIGSVEPFRQEIPIPSVDLRWR